MGSLLLFAKDWYRVSHWPTAKEPQAWTAAWGRFNLPHKRDSSPRGKLSSLPLLPSCFGHCCVRTQWWLWTLSWIRRREKWWGPQPERWKNSGFLITWLSSQTRLPLQSLLGEIINILLLKAQLLKVSVTEWCHSMAYLLLTHVNTEIKECFWNFTTIWF